MNNKYAKIFEHVPISIWEEDWSQVKIILDKLRDRVSVNEIEYYLNEHPELVHEILDSIKVIRVNEKTIEIYEAENEEQIKTGIKQTFCPDSYLTFKDELVSIYKGDKEFEMEMISKTFKGKDLYTIIHIKLPEDHDDYHNVLVAMVDITPSKIQHKEFLETKAKFHRSFYQGVVGMAITDVSGNILDVNSSFCEFTKYSREELLCMNCIQLEYSSEKSCMNSMSTLLSTGIDSIKDEQQILRKDGKMVWALVGLSLIKTEENEPLYFVGQIVDIDREKNNIISLENNVKKYRQLLDSTNVIYIILDEFGTIKEYSSLFIDLFEGEIDGITQKSLRDFVTTESIGVYDKAFQAIKQGETVNGIDVALTNNSVRRWVSINASMIKNGGEKIFILMTDISVRKNKELAKLIEKEKNRDRLRSNIKELRNQISKMGK